MVTKTQKNPQTFRVTRNSDFGNLREGDLVETNLGLAVFGSWESGNRIYLPSPGSNDDNYFGLVAYSFYSLILSHGRVLVSDSTSPVPFRKGLEQDYREYLWAKHLFQKAGVKL